jgi:hypothetical protein
VGVLEEKGPMAGCFVGQNLVERMTVGVMMMIAVEMKHQSPTSDA